MELTTKTIELRTLIASEGHKLTENKEMSIAERTVCNEVILAVNASPDDWREITDAEADAIKEQQQSLVTENS